MAFLDDFMNNIASLPSDLRRCYTLMRQLDQQLQVLQKQNEERCDRELEIIRKGAESGNLTDASVFRFSDDALAEQKDCSNIADEKVALAIQAYDMVDGHIQRLDKYMKKFDEELRRERELAGSLGTMDQNTDNSGRMGRGNETSKPGRKRPLKFAHHQATSLPIKPRLHQSQVVSEPLNIDLDLPVDPNEPTYCFCNQVSYGEMIACDGPDCNIEWFHYGCVGIKERPKGNWYCPNCIGNDRRRKGK